MVENRWKIILPISLFVGLFMVVFQPFGLIGYQGPYKFSLLAGYGIVTFLVLLFDLFLLPALIPRFFRFKNWYVWKELLFLLWILFTIGLGNFYYTVFMFQLHLSWSGVITVQLFTLAIGVIPITTITIVKQNYLHRKYRLTADQLSSSLESKRIPDETAAIVQFASDNGKDVLSLPVADLLAVDAEGNYITLYYLRSGVPNSSLLRNTLSYAEEVVSGHPIMFRCHRSFLVNLDRIRKVHGNSQGYRLEVPGVPEPIPVSRSNAARLKELLSR